MSTDPTPVEPPAATERRRRFHLLYRALGVVCLVLAVIGAFLPVMPSTVFVLVAVWAFARGSPEWADRLRAHPRFGPAIRDWEARRAIPTRAKILAVTMMSVSFAILAFASHNLWLTGGVGVVLVAVAAFIVTRPSA